MITENNSLDFKNQRFDIGLDVHHKNWTATIISNHLVGYPTARSAYQVNAPARFEITTQPSTRQSARVNAPLCDYRYGLSVSSDVSYHRNHPFYFCSNYY